MKPVPQSNLLLRTRVVVARGPKLAVIDEAEAHDIERSPKTVENQRRIRACVNLAQAIAIAPENFQPVVGEMHPAVDGRGAPTTLSHTGAQNPLSTPGQR